MRTVTIGRYRLMVCVGWRIFAHKFGVRRVGKQGGAWSGGFGFGMFTLLRQFDCAGPFNYWPKFSSH